MIRFYLILFVLGLAAAIRSLIEPPLLPVILIHDVAMTRKPWDFWTITPEKLEQIVGLIRRLGMKTLSLAQVEALLRGELSSDAASGALLFTVDDGTASVATEVAPRLSRERLSAVFFVVGRFTPPGYLSGDQIRSLIAQGHEVGSHGATHVSLAPVPVRTKRHALSGEQVRRELDDSRAVLSGVTGRDIVALAYPQGEYDDRTKSAAREAGYRLAFTTDPGYLAVGDDPLELSRLQLNWNSTLSDIESYLTWPRRHRLKLAMSWGLVSVLSLVGALIARSLSVRR